MDHTIMGHVKGTENTSAPDHPRGQRRPGSDRAARRRSSSPRSGGRAWINGREVGGQNRLTYFDVSHD